MSNCIMEILYAQADGWRTAIQAEVSRMEAELAEEKRLFTQLCGDHEKLAMEAQQLRGKLAALEGQPNTAVLQQALEALIPLANAHFPNERELLTDDDVKAAGAAVVALQAAIAGAREAQPMTEEQLGDLWNLATRNFDRDGNYLIRFGRAVEACHGITGDKS